MGDFTSRALTGRQSSQVNAPTVQLTSPQQSARFTAPAIIDITANATDTDGRVAKVEFFQGSVKIGEIATAPYILRWSTSVAGTYQLRAVATDNTDLKGSSQTVTVVVDSAQAPVVTLTQPTLVQTFTAPANITLAATASAVSGVVTRVEFFNGNIKLGEDATAPYSMTWPNVPAGTYMLRAIATSSLGLQGTSNATTITVNAAPVAPVVSLTAPANNATFTAPANINLTANATDADGTVTRVEFYNGATRIAEDTSAPFSFAWTNIPAGTYTLRAVATDNTNRTASSANVTVTVNAGGGGGGPMPPMVTLTAPLNNATFAAPATINLTATASDSDGTIARVEFYNGLVKIGEDATAPYAFSWTGVMEGTHRVHAVAVDSQNLQTASSGANVVVTGATGSLDCTRDICRVTLAWDPPEASPVPVAGYKIHYGFAPGVYSAAQDAGNNLQHTLILNQNGLYFFAVTSYSALSEESLFSNEVSKGF